MVIEWIIIGSLVYVVFTMGRRITKLEDIIKYPPEVVLDPTEGTQNRDVAARLIDRHVQDHHKGGK